MLHKSAALYCVDDAGKHSLRVNNRAVFYVLRMSCIDLHPDLCAEVCVCEKERERERECVCVCVACVCVCVCECVCVCGSGIPYVMGTKCPHNDGNIQNPCPCGDIFWSP